MTDYIKQLESKVKDCKNTNTIFDTRKYVLLEDAKEVLNQALNIPVVSQQRELLKFFSAQLSENLDIDVGMNYITEDDIEECLKNFNCG